MDEVVMDTTPTHNEAQRARSAAPGACGCCGSPIAKPSPTLEYVDDWPTQFWYCADHWVWCHRNASLGPNGEDWDEDDPEHLAYVATLEAEWEALPWGPTDG